MSAATTSGKQAYVAGPSAAICFLGSDTLGNNAITDDIAGSDVPVIFPYQKQVVDERASFSNGLCKHSPRSLEADAVVAVAWPVDSVRHFVHCDGRHPASCLG